MVKKEKTTRNFALRIDSDAMEAIEKWAEDEFRSVNGQIQWMLEYMLKKNGRLKRPDNKDKISNDKQ
ncbi:MAG: Arc family DNA-binding protein [Dysgonamonadaceae bacterium]